MKFISLLPRNARKSFTLGLLAAVMMFAAALQASAQQTIPCTAVSSPPNADASVFEVEGKITAYDRTNRTITANGVTFAVPATLLIKTADLDAPVGNITFEALTDPSAESLRSIIGGSTRSSGAIASGETTIGGTSPGTVSTCVSFVADSVFIELAENVLSGSLSDVNATDGSFRVNGVLVRMNTDARWPANLTDIGGNAITLDKLVGFEGTLVTAEGYFDATVSTLFGVAVETEVVTQQPGKDGVAITRTEGRTGNRELRVEGVNTRNGQGVMASTVDVHAGVMNATGTGCAGPRLGAAAVSQTDGIWSFRQRNIATIPTTVCAVSPLGGVAQRAVEIRQ
ncbi:MAG TPA: hypothetical protein VFX96_15840 [Pyrinomonadaceae bacterium]|nr:hypothetical protein [Pyrinomonadaceae bacterium]